MWLLASLTKRVLHGFSWILFGSFQELRKSWVNVYSCHRRCHGKDRYLRFTEIGNDFSIWVKLRLVKISFGWGTSIYKCWILCASSSNCSFSMDPYSLRLLRYRDVLGDKPIPSFAVHHKHTQVQWCSGSRCHSIEVCTLHLIPPFCACICHFFIHSVTPWPC